MKQLFLTSSISFVAHDLVKHLDLYQGTKLVFIDTAAEAETGDKQWLKDDRQSLVDAGFNVTDYTITGKQESQINSDLKRFDYFYISGGNSYYLLQQAQKCNFRKLIRDWVIKQNKTYIGTSAGSVTAGPKLPQYYLEECRELGAIKNQGFGLVNFTILPHWGSDYFKDRYLDHRLEMAYSTDQVSLILLTDTQYIHIQDDQMEIIDESIEKS